MSQPQYASQSDLTTLGIPAAALSGISGPEQDAALQAASAIIDSYLASRFDLPLASVGLDIKSCCAQLAAWSLMKRRGFNAGSTDAETLRMSYEDQVKWLTNVAKGLATPAFPQTQDLEGTNPQEQAFVVAPSQGSIGLSGGSFRTKESDVVSSVGTVGPPKLRGW